MQIMYLLVSICVNCMVYILLICYWLTWIGPEIVGYQSENIRLSPLVCPFFYYLHLFFFFILFCQECLFVCFVVSIPVNSYGHFGMVIRLLPGIEMNDTQIPAIKHGLSNLRLICRDSQTDHFSWAGSGILSG